jgi:hypothetical protein
MMIDRLLMIGFAVLAISPVFAASEICYSIEADKDRLACFDRQASPAHGQQGAAKSTKSPAGTTYVDPVDSLRAENDKVSARLKGICRGC